MTAPDPVALSADLIRCASVTPEEAGALDVIRAPLEAAGFRCTRIDRGGVSNLYARWGSEAPVFGFNGHVDVVPVGDEAAWTRPPFSGEIADGVLWGRGAQDMKTGVAAFVAAACRFVTETPPKGSVALLITGDEEGPAEDGTVAILDWMAANGERVDACLVGEPTCPETMGEMMKIGRRGSINAWITARGRQGHVAYPHKANNPLPALVHLLDRLSRHELDQGTAHFQPSTLAVTSIDVGNPASNVIPSEGRAALNIRFNDAHTGAGLDAWLRSVAAEVAAFSGVELEVKTRISGESFITEPGALSDAVSAAVKSELGIAPDLSTSGGTSDARFMRAMCPVVEFGLVGDAMHQVDERTPVEQVETLCAIYARALGEWFRKA
ncbi:succinyl-diaminopimelate desuccinylase [Rhodovulum sp. DZ06]|uniref:succinyl-diaminopimelate desuccinylase n=1 Tax=Rhodovulum sp. DZ06 TaxID=3425126 RepID=UPI003D3544D0